MEFPEILQEIRGSMHTGRLKLQSSGFLFKNNKTGKVDQFQSSDIDRTHWLLRARGHCLKIVMKTGATQRFDGFKESDYDRLSEFVNKNYDCKLEKKDLSVRGWNWGVADFIGSTLDFKVEGLTAFEVPLSNISHSQISKNEVTIEFHLNDDVPVSLMEMRFHIPSNSATTDVDPVAEFYTSVMAKADVIQATGDAITTFTEIQCLTPRGRYDIKIFPSFLQLHGKTFDYKIPYDTILRLFLLPHRDNRQMFFVISLDPPIKQGQTRYHFLIVLFNKEDEKTLELSLTDEELDKKYDGKLARVMSGPEYEIISRVMKCLVNKKITVPGSFVGHSGTNSIACSYKAATGSLYPLERGFMFVHKPPLHIRFDEIVSVNFARSAGTNRSFDFDIETQASTTYNFVGIEKEEYGKLYDFVTQKKLRVKNIGGKMDGRTAPSYTDDMMGSDDDDDARDPYMERMKKEGKERAEEDGGQDDDDDEDDDVDFEPAGSASEPDDEYDSNPESTDSEGEEDGEDAEGGSKKKKKKKESSEEEINNDDNVNEDGDDDDDKPLKKEEKQKKPKAEKKQKSEVKETKKKKKKTRDADQPKRAQTAYFLWLAEIRPALKEEFSDLSMIELTKKAGERWKEVKDKSKWEEMSAKEKVKYEIAMAEYNKKPKKEESSPKESKAKKTKSPKKSKDTGAKSKDYISDSSDEEASKKDSDEDVEDDDDDTPLKKKVKTEEEDDDDKPLKKKGKKEEIRTTRHSRKEALNESDIGDLPEDEESAVESEDAISAPEEEEEESDRRTCCLFD